MPRRTSPRSSWPSRGSGPADRMSPTAPVREEERRKEDLDAEDVPDPAEEETQDVPQDPVDAPEEAPEVN